MFRIKEINNNPEIRGFVINDVTRQEEESPLAILAKQFDMLPEEELNKSLG